MPLNLCALQSPRGLAVGKEGRRERAEETTVLHPGGIKSLGAGMIDRELPFGPAGPGKNLGNLNIYGERFRAQDLLREQVET